MQWSSWLLIHSSIQFFKFLIDWAIFFFLIFVLFSSKQPFLPSFLNKKLHYKRACIEYCTSVASYNSQSWFPFEILSSILKILNSILKLPIISFNILLLYYFIQRTTVKRMCIKTLPPVLVIQLKRFGYDWEAGRALKFDDYFEVRQEMVYQQYNCILFLYIKDPSVKSVGINLVKQLWVRFNPLFRILALEDIWFNGKTDKI